jgi:hypothetical protein
MSTVNLKENVIFEKSIIISKNEGSIQNQELTTGTVGQLRFNQTSRKFEGFHCVANSNAGADIFGNKWRPFTQDVASTSNLGIFRVGTNLTMNATTGILSSIASGESRIYQLVITVSPIVGAADYQTINTAISHAIGTPANNYTDGTLTSNLGSAPSPTYPFVIQLGPGQYSETLNKIILPDYVSLRGENNYNSVITQNHGSNGTITNASMLIVGQNSEIKNLVINLADTVSSSNTNAIYSLNKSNVVIDNCIISCNSNITTTQNSYGIFMDGGDNNSITNNKVDFNSNTLLGNLNTISITNSTPRLINNYINILAPNISISNGINLNNCIGTESITDKVYIENLTLSNNYYNTLTTSINTGIFINNTPLLLKNSDIEVSNDPSLTTNYGIQFKSVPNSLANPLPYAGNTTSNVISFVNVTNGINIGQNLINSSNTSALNFLTANYQRGQYVNVSGSSSNNGIYKIASLTSSSLTLENGFNLISEAKTALNTITLKGLFDMNIYNSRINGSTNSIKNNNNNSNYICNLYDIINETSAYSISPSFVFYRNYKTLTVGKVNCDFNNLYNAMSSITDNNSMTRYLIKIQSGIYHETSYITCKEFVDIEGNGEDNTILQFYQAANTSGTPMNTTSCILLCSNITIKNITIKNSPTLYTAGQTTSTVFYNPNTIVNLILENLIINSTCSSYYNTGIYIVNGSALILRNINLIIYATNTAGENTGITAKECNTFNLYNISSTIDSSFSLVSNALYLTNSSCNIYNPNFTTHSAVNYNSGVYSYSTNTTQKLIQIYNGQIRAYDAIEYSIYTDNYYTIMCNGTQLLGDTFVNSISSRLYCNSCYTFTDENDKTNIQSLNSRGQNEQSSLTYSSLTIGDTAGKRNATGKNNVFIGVDSGSNVSTASHNTFLGYNTGKTLNVAGNNTLIGSSVGQFITTGTGNTITGSNAGINLSTGNTNTITGAYAGKELTTGFGNTINGTSSGLTLTTGFRNTFMGDGSGLSSNTSFFNTFIGSLSGYDNNSGNNNTYLGYQSGYEGMTSNNNVFIGTSSGYTNQSSNIVAIGAQSGYNNTSSIKNTYIGHQTGYNNVTGDCNTYLGYNAGYSAASASGDFNIAIGNEAGYSITSGARNVLIGSTKNATSGTNDAAGWSLQDGTDNIHIGVNTGSQATSAINNVFIGSDIGTSITTASNNILIGKNTGNSITNNDGNIIIGSETGNDNTYGNALIIGQNSGVGHTGSPAFVIGHNAGKNIEGVNNMFIGQSSGGISQTGKTGNYNLAIGPFSGFNLKAGSRNIIVGTGDSLSSAGGVITSGSDNTLLGFNSGRAVQTGVGNTLIGSNAGANLTSGANNLILGYKSAYTLGTGSNNISLGPEAGYYLSIGSGNIFSGYQAGYNTTSGFNNINIGVQSGYQSQTTRNNIHIGYQSGYQSIANNNLFLGSYSGLQNTTGIDNIFVGSNSGAGYNTSSQQIGNYNIFMGSDTGKSNFDGTRNIYLGLNSGKNNINGSKNVYIGENTGRDSLVSRNIFIGTTSDNTKGVGYKAQSAGGLDTGDKNVFIGHDVGIENTSGKGNIFLGDSAGQKNTTGEQNIYIGKNAGNKANASTADYNIALGYNSGQNNLGGKENILIGKDVASITINSYNQNIIIGSEAGQYINQDNQIFIGTKAGQNNTTGDNNIFIGKDAGKANSISNDNVVIGSDAGTFLIGSGSNGKNTIIGSNAAHDLLSGTNNIFLGANSGLSAVSSINNVVIGANSMSIGDANNVVIIGNNAGQNNISDANIFIGSNAGVQNTSGLGNIFIGHEAGYNVNSNGNIIFGKETVSSGRIADNNIIFGNETSKNVTNKTNFQNNIVMGSNAGKESSLSINSIMIGSNSVNLGTGGDVNIIMGNNTSVNLGNPNFYYSTTTTQITILINYVYIDIPFGSGGYYFKCNDYIIIESLNNDYVLQSQIVFIEAGTGANLYKTKLIFNSKPTEIIPIGSRLYVKNVKADGIGMGDYSKASSNMCLGDQCGFELTTGSKNSAIGDNAMYNNKVGKYNITLGTEAGYNVNTNNNLCLGIKAGYSIDTYKLTTNDKDYRFYQSNNTIISNTSDFSALPYGTVFEINGSSNNDDRYNINNSTQNSIIVQGYPFIKENGLVANPSQSNFVLGSSEIFYINYSVTALIEFYANKIIINYASSGLASTAYDTIQNATHFTISGSLYNDGVKVINYYLVDGFSYPINLNSSNITILTIQNNYSELTTSNISLTINNIANSNLLNSLNNNSFNNNIFSSDNIYIQYGTKSCQYKLSLSQPYYFYNTYNYQSINKVSFIINGAIIDKQFTSNTNTKDNINKLYIQGYDTTVTIKNVILSLDSVPYLGTHATRFVKSNNTIQIASDNNNAYFVLPPTGTLQIPSNYSINCSTYIANTLIEIIGSVNNDGYYFVKSISDNQFIEGSWSGYILYIDENYPIKNDYDDTGNVIMKRVAINNNVFNSNYKSDSSFKGNIIKVKYRNNNYQNYAFGTYVLENFYNGWFGMNDNLLNFYNYPKTFTGSPLNNTNLESITLDMKFADTGLKTITNNYISSNDLIFQTSNISFNTSNITCNALLLTITSNISYDFVHIVAPVIIKIEGSNQNNNGFFLVASNPRPFTTLYLDSTSTLYNEINTSNITIKTNSISSYLGNIDLSNMSIGTNYLIQGSKYNDNKVVSIYNSVDAKKNKSIYLTDTSTIVNDTYNDFSYSLKRIVSGGVGVYDKGAVNNVGYFQHFILDSVSFTIDNDTTITFTYNDSDPYNPNFSVLKLYQYLKLSGTPSNTYDGLYYITNINYTLPNLYTISFLAKYQDKDGNIIIGNPFSPFIPTTSTCTVISNQFIFNGKFNINDGIDYYSINITWNSIISGYGENAKFIKFTGRDGSITNYTSNVASTIMGSVSNNSLTFEIESFNLNTSDIAVSLVETCPKQIFYSDEGTNDSTIYCHYTSFVIDFGSPNPSTRTSNIYRNRIRPIIYSSSDITYNNFDANGHEGATYTLNLLTSNLVVSNFSSVSNSNNIIYGKLFSKDNFAMFYPGQIIGILFEVPFDYIFYTLIKSITNNNNTIEFDVTYGPSPGGAPTKGLKLITRNTIYDTELNFEIIDNSFLGTENNLLIFKNQISTGIFDNAELNLCDINIEMKYINNIGYQSSVSSLVIPPILSEPITIPLTFHLDVVEPEWASLTFDSTTSQIKLESFSTSNLAVFRANELIQISGTSKNNGIYLISSLGTSRYIINILESYKPLINENGLNGNKIVANNISSSLLNDLSIYDNYISVTIGNTISNNKTYQIETVINNDVANVIFVTYSDVLVYNNVTTEIVANATIYGTTDLKTTSKNLQELCMDHTMLIPTDNIIDNYTNISFHNLTVTGTSDISFYASNNTITSTITDLSSFLLSEYILISGTTNNNGLLRINDTTTPTSNTIVIASQNTLTNELNQSATILANNINSSDISNTDLSVFDGNQYLIVALTDNNNNTFLSNISSKSSYSIFIDSPTIVNETPVFCTIEKSILINETQSVTGVLGNISFNNTNKEISVSNSSTDFSNFRVGQNLQITNTTNNNSNITISDTSPTSNSIITVDTLVNELNSNATITKKIDFTIIGEPIQSQITSTYIELYHYEDSEGNNTMIGSFAGQYVGTLNNAIYNVIIGSRCAQVNHGSGNIFIGNDSKLAENATEGSSTYTNKFAIYKNNSLGIPSNPLIGGDFGTGIVGINTITPETFTQSSDISITNTKLIVNGGAIANSFSPFTGCHIVNFLVNSNVAMSLKPGMILSSIGIVNKQSIINTFCTVDLSQIENDKKVFGVYAYSEQTRISSEPEYIINNKNEYTKNLSYSTDTKTLYYAAAIGEGCILVCNYGGDIGNGDYITSCPISGYGSLQKDDILHSYTVAKCTENIDWNSINETILCNGNGQLYKVYLASCTYHCG